MKYKAVLFDLDGTLLDTTEGILCSVNHMIEVLKLTPLSETELKNFIGPPIQESIRKYFNLSEDEILIATEIFRNIYKEKYLNKADVYSNIFDLLSKLKKENIKMGVATYKREDYAIQLLENIGLASYMKCIVGGDSNNKLSKADIISKCISNLDINREEIIMIGDTIFDAIGAENAGVDFIAVTYGFGFKRKEDLLGKKVKSTVNNVRELIELFEKMC